MEAPLRVAIDRSEIAELVARYAIALDTRDWELLTTCFVPDATFRFAHVGEVSGVAEIVAVCRRSLEPLDASQHLVGGASIDVEGDRARSRCPFQAQHVKREVDGGGLYIVAGTYVDEVRRTDAGWRIVHRELQRAWTDGNPAVLGYAADAPGSG